MGRTSIAWPEAVRAVYGFFEPEPGLGGKSALDGMAGTAPEVDSAGAEELDAGADPVPVVLDDELREEPRFPGCRGRGIGRTEDLSRLPVGKNDQQHGQERSRPQRRPS